MPRILDAAGFASVVEGDRSDEANTLLARHDYATGVQPTVETVNLGGMRAGVEDAALIGVEVSRDGGRRRDRLRWDRRRARGDRGGFPKRATTEGTEVIGTLAQRVTRRAAWRGGAALSSLEGLCLRSPYSCGKLAHLAPGPAANQLPLPAAQFEPDHLVEHAGLLSHAQDLIESHLLISGGVLPAHALVGYDDHAKSAGVDAREFPFTCWRWLRCRRAQFLRGAALQAKVGIVG
jgi:hypothetical protein